MGQLDSSWIRPDQSLEHPHRSSSSVHPPSHQLHIGFLNAELPFIVHPYPPVINAHRQSIETSPCPEENPGKFKPRPAVLL